MEKLVERITCKKCSAVEHHDIETLNKPIKISDTRLSAVILKKFKCGECGSNEAQREFVKNSESEAI